MMAAVLAGAITFVVFRRLRAGLSKHSTTQIVAAASDLPAGVALSLKDVSLVDWPSELALPGSLNKTEAVIGHPLMHSVTAQQPILQHDLGVEGSGLGLATKIPPGMRATAVRSNEIVGVAGFLYPGSHVDVLATYNLPGGKDSLTQTVLQDVEVLTAGQTIEPDPQGKPQQVNVVTVLVTPQDSQKLQLASTQGTIQFVLRNGTDKESAQVQPTRIDQLIASAKQPDPLPLRRTAKHTTPISRKPSYSLEMIQGTKRTVQTFGALSQEEGTK